MTFNRSTDYEAIRSILAEKRCFRQMANDAAPARDALHVGPVSGITYVLAEDDGKPVALFLLCVDKQPPAVAEVHFCVTPGAWGRSVEVGLEFLDWVWRETSLNRLVGQVPEYNRLALRLTRAVGFVEKSVRQNAGTKNGTPFDLIITEITRPAHEQKSVA